MDEDDKREIRRLWEKADQDDIQIHRLTSRCSEYRLRIDRLGREIASMKASDGARHGEPDPVYPGYVENRFSHWYIHPHEDGTSDISTDSEVLVKNIDRHAALKMIGKHNEVIKKLMLVLSDFGRVSPSACESSWYRKESE